jgi:uncharacterized protein (TIGR02466 family)
MTHEPEPQTVTVSPLFITEVYRADLSHLPDFTTFLEDIDDTCRAIADEDEAGQDWSQQKAYLGYTSYGSLNDLPLRASVFDDLKTHLDAHAIRFANLLEYDIPDGALKLDNMWINILEPLGTHSGHIHPHSLISGTVYISVPDGAGALKFEDPRLLGFMNTPPRKVGARREHLPFVYEAPKAGTVLMWESWLRHEVPINLSQEVRISISFNYSW